MTSFSPSYRCWAVCVVVVPAVSSLAPPCRPWARRLARRVVLGPGVSWLCLPYRRVARRVVVWLAVSSFCPPCPCFSHLVVFPVVLRPLALWFGPPSPPSSVVSAVLSFSPSRLLRMCQTWGWGLVEEGRNGGRAKTSHDESRGSFSVLTVWASHLLGPPFGSSFPFVFSPIEGAHIPRERGGAPGASSSVVGSELGRPGGDGGGGMKRA